MIIENSRVILCLRLVIFRIRQNAVVKLKCTVGISIAQPSGRQENVSGAENTIVDGLVISGRVKINAVIIADEI